MANYIVEVLIRASIIITVLSIIILSASKFITKRLGYGWRKAAWLIMLVCAILPLRMSKTDTTIEKYQSYKQEGKYIESINQYEPEIKDAERLRENNQALSSSKVYDRKDSSDVLSEEPALEKLGNAISENALFIVCVWLLGIYISWNIHRLKEKRLQKMLSDNSFKIEDSSTINLIENAKQKIGYEKKLEAFYCTEINSPVIYGIKKPKLYFPERMEFEDEKINNILKHEMIHLKSKDALYKKIINYATVIYWFNPLIYIIKNKAFEDIEYVCDSKVVEGLEKKQIGMYCRTILETVPVKSNSAISFNNSKIKIKNRIDNCFLENKKSHRKKIYVLLGGLMVVIAITVCTIAGTLVHENKKNNKTAKQSEEAIETTKNEKAAEENETTVATLRLSQRALHYDTDFSISKEKSEALKKMWLDDLSESDCKTVKEKINNVHSYLECELVEEFRGECPKDSVVWNNIDDDPNDNVIPGYTIPDIISDLESASSIVNKQSFSERISNIVRELQKLKKTHDIDLFYKIHQETHDLSYWAINYPLESLKIAPADWHGIYVYFGTLDDVETGK